jgi:hypothetical protein
VTPLNPAVPIRKPDNPCAARAKTPRARTSSLQHFKDATMELLLHNNKAKNGNQKKTT